MHGLFAGGKHQAVLIQAQQDDTGREGHKHHAAEMNGGQNNGNADDGG